MTYGYDNNAYATPDQKKRKIAIVGVSSLILVAMVVGVAVGVNGRGGDDESLSSTSNAQISTSNKAAIQSICQPTDYRQTCEDSLTKVAGNTTDPQKLVQAGFQVAMDALRNAIKKSATLKEVSEDKMASQAVDNCLELMDDAIDELKNSFNQIGEFDFRKLDEYVDNLKVWLSATITYQQTCIDGFQNTTGPAREKMEKILMTSNQLSNNGLAMIDGLSSIVKDLNIAGFSRRLLATQGGFPSWLSANQRRLLAATPATIKPDIVVAQDGTGQYKTINEAINNIPQESSSTFVVYIKAGVYKEQVTLSRSHTHIMLIGDGPTKTKITGDLSYAGGVLTLHTATVSVSGSYFIAKDIGFENSAGAIGHEAVALKVEADMSVFFNCRMDGFQDTLYALAKRQFYRDCTITGTIDIIFGDAVAVFQNCTIVVREPLDFQKCTVTAQARNSTRQATGFVIQNSTIIADPKYFPVRFENPAYLGRPNKEYSRTIYMESQIDDLISPEGWLPWFGSYGIDTCFYAEYKNSGPGANTAKRVTWKGYKKITPEEASEFTAGKFLGGDAWIPATGVPYTSGFVEA